jgi:ABC-type Na+ transport system ATPase subunit NatA
MKTDGAIKQIEIYRRMNGPERLRIGCELYDLAKEIITASVSRMFPNLNEKERLEKVKERMSYDTK